MSFSTSCATGDFYDPMQEITEYKPVEMPILRREFPVLD